MDFVSNKFFESIFSLFFGTVSINGIQSRKMISPIEKRFCPILKLRALKNYFSLS